MTSFFTEAEQDLITKLSVKGGWDQEEAEPLKRKIKDHYMAVGLPSCCYCRTSMRGWHRMSIDVEHVLPKVPFHEYTFELLNLNIACKRCNMTIKGQDVSFFLGDETCSEPFCSALYSFVHPNLDEIDEHLLVTSYTVGQKSMTKYFWFTPKGRKSYQYFELDELEVNSFDNAQGSEVVSPGESLDLEIHKQIDQAVTEAES